MKYFINIYLVSIRNIIFVKPKKRKPGRPEIALEHPELVVEAARILEDYGAHAHARRRDAIGKVSGLSLKVIRNHLKSFFPEVFKKFKVSKSTIASWLVPPNRGRNHSSRYKAYILAKVSVIENNEREVDENVLYIIF